MKEKKHLSILLPATVICILAVTIYFQMDQRYDFRQQYCQRKRTSHLLRRHTRTKDFHFL